MYIINFVLVEVVYFCKKRSWWEAKWTCCAIKHVIHQSQADQLYSCKCYKKLNTDLDYWPKMFTFSIRIMKFFFWILDLLFHICVDFLWHMMHRSQRTCSIFSWWKFEPTFLTLTTHQTNWYHLYYAPCWVIAKHAVFTQGTAIFTLSETLQIRHQLCSFAPQCLDRLYAFSRFFTVT